MPQARPAHTGDQPPSSPALAFALGACHAVIMVLAFPAPAIWWLAPAAITPLCALALRTTRPKRDALLAASATLPMWAVHHAWLVDVTLPGYPLLCLNLAMYPALFVWLGALLRGLRPGRFTPPVWLSFALLWTALEHFRAEVFLDGYPWYLLGHTPVRSTASAEPADIAHLLPLVGVFGVSFLLALVGAVASLAAAHDARGRRIAHAAVALVIGWAALTGLGVAAQRFAPDTGDSFALRVGVVQTNVPQDNKLGWSPAQRLEDFNGFAGLTTALVAGASADDQRPHALLWPETMFPGVGLDAGVIDAERTEGLVFRDINLPTTHFFDELMTLQRTLAVPMLVGALGHEGFRIDYEHDDLYLFDRKFNSVFLVDNGRVVARYDKLQLTPFGEVMPVISRSDWLEQRLLALGAGGMRFDLDPGDAPAVFDIPAQGGHTARIVTPICFELTSSRIGRRVVMNNSARAADAIAHITNEGWFGDHPGTRENHAQIARVRAMELRTPVVRAANTGVSVAFDAQGSIIPIHTHAPDSAPAARRIDAWSAGAGVVELRIPADDAHRARLTPAAHLRDAPGWLATALSAVLLIARWRQGRRAATMPAQEGAAT